MTHSQNRIENKFEIGSEIESDPNPNPMSHPNPIPKPMLKPKQKPNSILIGPTVMMTSFLPRRIWMTHQMVQKEEPDKKFNFIIKTMIEYHSSGRNDSLTMTSSINNDSY